MRLITLPRSGFAELSNETTGDLSRAPIAEVLEVPEECFLRFAWEKRFSKLVVREVDVVEEDKKGDQFEGTGHKMKVVLAISSTDEETKLKLGFFHFYGIVEKLTVNHHALQLRALLGDEVKYAIKEKCLAEFGEAKSFRKEGLAKKQLTLRYCFFNMNRTLLLRSILGNPIFHRELATRVGLVSIWHNKTLTPNPIYLRAVLCGAKLESWLLVRDVLEKSFLRNGETLKDWLLSGNGSLEVNGNVDLAPPYTRARDCDDQLLMHYVKELPQPGKESRFHVFVGKVADFFRNTADKVKTFFKTV